MRVEALERAWRAGREAQREARRLTRTKVRVRVGLGLGLGLELGLGSALTLTLTLTRPVVPRRSARRER